MKVSRLLFSSLYLINKVEVIMLNLNSFNHLLPVSSDSAYLLKGVMTSALLSLSFVSLSSHAATSNSVNSISRSEAANPANFYQIR